MRLGKIGITLALCVFCLPFAKAGATKQGSARDCASNLITEDVKTAIRRMQMHKRLVKAYKEVARLFPLELTDQDMNNVLSIADFNPETIAFLHKLCARYKGSERSDYLNLMMEKSVFGRVVPAFSRFIDDDFEFGKRLLQQDDPIIDEFINDALDERYFH